MTCIGVTTRQNSADNSSGTSRSTRYVMYRVERQDLAEPGQYCTP
ncbi:hypothetical protein ACF1AB_40520 [Streptomyces sp. NPDC014846]